MSRFGRDHATRRHQQCPSECGLSCSVVAKHDPAVLQHAFPVGAHQIGELCQIGAWWRNSKLTVIHGA
jgi:hypothetical protein